MAGAERAGSGTRWVRLARWAVSGYALLMVAVSIAGTALFPEYARQNPMTFRPSDAWSAQQVQTALEQLGWPGSTPAYVELARTLVMLPVLIGVGLLILWRRAPSWFTLFLAFVLITFSGGDPTFLPVAERVPELQIFNDLMGAASWQLFFILFFFFPDGQAVPRWTRWVAAAWIAWVAASPFILEVEALYDLLLPLFLGLVILSAASQVYRYLRYSNAVQRQQTKMVVTWAAVQVLLLPIALPVVSNPPGGTDLRLPFLLSMSVFLVFNLFFAMVPVAIALAIFKYRLWDIDLVIRRTLVYGAILAVLAALYLAGVTLLQGFFTAVTGQQSPLAVVLSTLLIAALFTPLRRRIQAAVDRRFYRSRYDPEQALRRFSEQASAQADPDQLSAELIASIQDSLQPLQSSLWMVGPPVERAASMPAAGAARSLGRYGWE